MAIIKTTFAILDFLVSDKPYEWSIQVLNTLSTLFSLLLAFYFAAGKGGVIH